MSDTLLDLNTLHTRCQQETENFRHERPYDPTYCLQILRIAFYGKNRDAFELIVAIYTIEIRKRIPPKVKPLLDLDDIIQETWKDVWHRTKSDSPLSFEFIGAFISFLDLVKQRAIIRMLRKESSSHNASSIDDPAQPNGEPVDPVDVLDDVVRKRLYERMMELTPDPLEQLILLLYAKWRYKASEISAFLLAQGHQVNTPKVTKRLHGMFQRYKDDPEIRGLLGSDET